MRYRTRTTIAGALVGGLFLAPFVGARAAAVETAPLAKRQYPSCATEDSANCVWQNQGPGFSFVSGPNRHPAPRVYRVSDRLADKLVARRGTWERPGRWLGLIVDTTHGHTYRVNRETVVSPVGGTTFFVRNGRVASS
ncbi:MAG: hypothetical protein ACRDQD_12410 [Nocardioidaceae bacterium]